FPVERLAERIDDAAEHLVADRHRDNAAGPLDEIAFLDLLELAEQHRADALCLEVQRDPEHAMRELEHLARHGVLEAVHTGDPVADLHDAADLGDIDIHRVTANLLADDLGNLVSFDCHLLHPTPESTKPA